LRRRGQILWKCHIVPWDGRTANRVVQSIKRFFPLRWFIIRYSLVKLQLKVSVQVSGFRCQQKMLGLALMVLLLNKV
jgi:hypothetical protein